MVNETYQIPGHRNTITMLDNGSWQVGAARRIAPLKGHTTTWGHREYGFTTDEGVTNRMQLGRAVLLVFKGPPPSGTECCHWDGNPANNHPDNLYWGTKSDNALDMTRHGTHNWQKITDQQVAEIREKFRDRQQPEGEPPAGSQRWLMQKYQLSQSSVSRIIRGTIRDEPPDKVAAAIRAEYTGPEPRHGSGITKQLAVEYGVSTAHVSRIVRNITRWAATGEPKSVSTTRTGSPTWADMSNRHLLSPSQYSRIARGLSRTKPGDTEAAGIRERHA